MGTSPWSGEIVRNEAAGVLRDGRVVLADADSRGLLADDPRPDDGVVAVEARQLVVCLPDEALRAVVPRGFHRSPAGVDRDVRAFAGEDRFLHVVGRELA